MTMQINPGKISRITSRRRTPGRHDDRLPAASRCAVHVALATVVVSVTALSAGSAVADVTPSSQRSPITYSDWHNDPNARSPFGGGDFGPNGQASPWDNLQAGRSGVDSQPATKAESTGVVLVDTLLGYQNAEAAGTGIVLTPDGEVLTNYHVVEGATSIHVTIASTGKDYTATVVGHDETDDIALLHLNGASKLSVAKLDRDQVTVGDKVTAVGNAGGSDNLSAADGTVVSLGATITTESEGSTSGETLQGLIETDADVVAGDSGGPLYSKGEVIGIDTAASTGTEINGYAIPIDDALSIVRQILSGNETSTVQVGAGAFLGVEVSPQTVASGPATVPGQRSGWYATDRSGAAVAGVLAGGPAAKAGLEAGDTITAIGGVTVTSADAVSTLLAKYEAGDEVKISWTAADGTDHSATVTLAASPVA